MWLQSSLDCPTSGICNEPRVEDYPSAPGADYEADMIACCATDPCSSMIGSAPVGTWTTSEPLGVLEGAGSATVGTDGSYTITGGTNDGQMGYVFVSGTTIRFYDTSCNLVFERDDAANNSDFYYTAGASFWCRSGGCPEV